MKTIHVNESKISKILEGEKRELPFLTFYEEVVKFVKGLLNDPIGTKPSGILISYDIHNGDLRKKLCDYNVITKDEDIDEPYDETTGYRTSRYYVSYKVHKENFKDKIRKLYSDLFSVNEDITKGIINNNTLYFIKKGNMLYPMGKAKDIIGKNKITYDEFDFGLSQKLVKNGYKIGINGDIK